MKRIIGIIILVCMLASMFTFVGTAAGVNISIVRISMTQPEVGGQKPMDAKVPETASSVVTNVTWTGSFDANGCFVAGNEYTVLIEVGVKDSKSNFKDTLSTLTVNEKNAKLYSIEANKKSITVSYTYAFPTSATPAPAPATTPAPAPATTPTPTPAPATTPASTTSTGFADVADDAYYVDAVKWAVERGITSGTSATTFSPDDICTKAQVYTFLWRAVGSPKHEGISEFLYINESDYYYHAAHWAKRKNFGADVKFKGDELCTRTNVIFYLWRLNGLPKNYFEHSSKFTDVQKGTNQADYIGWAVYSGITSGTSETTFSPNATCTRAQIVTFLYRAYTLGLLNA